MIDNLLLSNDNKIIFLILDGVGDIPHPSFGYSTPLEKAHKPNMDSLAQLHGVLGRMVPVDIGITPGSGPGHLSLFGYDPLRYVIGRGVLETLGLNMDLRKGDLAARANFCTLSDGIVTDRRAGRIETEKTAAICARLSEAIPEIQGVKIFIQPGKSHRFAIIFRGEGLSDRLTDADPHKENKPYIHAKPLDESAAFAAEIVNSFIDRAQVLLASEERANSLLLRGFSETPDIPPFSERYKMASLAIATYPMYRGVAKVLGMDVAGEPANYDESLRILRENYDRYQFFFFHVKETDVAGEDGNFPSKVAAIEMVDKLIPEINALKPQVLVITGDHSTPCIMKGHSWHPIPLLIVTGSAESDGMAFHERNCISGSIGTIFSRQLMSLALAYGMKLDKYGA